MFTEAFICIFGALALGMIIMGPPKTSYIDVICRSKVPPPKPPNVK